MRRNTTLRQIKCQNPKPTDLFILYCIHGEFTTLPKPNASSSVRSHRTHRPLYPPHATKRARQLARPDYSKHGGPGNHTLRLRSVDFRCRSQAYETQATILSSVMSLYPHLSERPMQVARSFSKLSVNAVENSNLLL